MLRGAAFCKYQNVNSFTCMIHGYMSPFSIEYYLTQSYHMYKVETINNFKLH